MKQLFALVLGSVLAPLAVGRGPDSAGIKSDPAAVALLKRSMSVYEHMAAFSAKSTWGMGGDGESDRVQRTYLYAKPNRFKVNWVNKQGTGQTSISDGKQIVEFDSDGAYGPVIDVAPKSIAVASSPLISNATLCNSLLFKFFAGPANFKGLVDSGQAPVEFGKTTKAPNGETSREVKFYAQGLYGHTIALIGEKSGLVYEIQCDSEPIWRAISSGGQFKSFEAQAEAAIAAAKDEKSKAAGQKAMAAWHKLAKGTNWVIVEDERFYDIKVPKSLPAATFALKTPKGRKVVQASAGPSNEPPVAIGEMAPDFTVTGLDGQPVKLSALRGHPILLDFWATWCGPCVGSLPHTQEVFDKNHAAGLQVFAISAEDKATVSSFIQEKKYTFPTCLDTTGAANQAYKIEAIPTTVVIDADGKLVAYIVGAGQDSAIAEALAKADVGK